MAGPLHEFGVKYIMASAQLRFWRVEELRVLCAGTTIWTCENPKKWLSYLAWRADISVVVETLKPAVLLSAAGSFLAWKWERASGPAGNGNVPLLQRGCAESTGTGHHDSQPPWELSPAILL